MSIYFDDFFFFPQSVFSDALKTFNNRQPTFPIYDIFHEENKVILEYYLAGYSSDKIKVWAEGTRLNVSADKRDSREGSRVAARAFHNLFEAKGFDLDNTQVSYVDGILKIEVPRIKPEEPEKRVFDIRTDKKLLR